MGNSVRLVVDSTADLGSEYLTAHKLTVVPLRVIFGEEELRDYFDITPDELYARMEREPNVLPRTSQPTPAEFEEAFREASGDGSTVICLTISSKLSGTWNTAMNARRALPDADIRVIDTLTVSVALNAMVKACVSVWEAGGSAEDILATVDFVKANQRTIFTLETLEYLRRGGRIGGAQALLGSLLSIKPVLEVRDGHVETLDKVRTYPRALDRQIEELRKACEEWKSKAVITIGHGARPERAAELAKRVAEYGVAEPNVIDIGPVIGVHGGPGSIGLTFHRPLPG